MQNLKLNCNIKRYLLTEQYRIMYSYSSQKCGIESIHIVNDICSNNQVNFIAFEIMAFNYIVNCYV